MTTRDRSSTLQAADQAPHSGGAMLIELSFDSGVLRLVAGPRNVTVGADVYTATGTLLTIDESQEAVDGVEGLNFSLSGLDPAVLPLVVSEPYKGRLVRMLEQRYDGDDAEVEEPQVEYVGRMTAMVSEEDAKSHRHTVSVQTEHFDADAGRSVNLRFSDSEQRRRFPDDRGAEYVTSMTERRLTRTKT
jgi:hypothetical protein